MAADDEGEDIVMPEHARQAKVEVYPEVKREVLRDLQPQAQLLLLAVTRKLRLSKRAYVLTGEIKQSYRVACEEYGERPRAHTQLWEYLKQMEGLGLVDLQPSGERHRGQSRRISVPDVPVKVLERELEKILSK